MHTSLKVSSYVIIRDGCPMRFRVSGNEDIEFTFGGRYDPFEFVFNARSLREFLRIGADALREVEALSVGEAEA